MQLSQLIELSERLSSDDSLPTLLPDSTNASVFVHDVREAGESLIQVAKEWINKRKNTVSICYTFPLIMNIFLSFIQNYFFLLCKINK